MAIRGAQASGRNLGRHYGDSIGVRIARLALVLLRAPRSGLTTEQLAERTGSSRATVYRDLAVLREADWPLVTHRPAGDGRTRYRARVGS